MGPGFGLFKVELARRQFGGHVDTYLRYLTRTDPPADAVVAAFAALPPGTGHRMLQTALDEGIDHVPDAPPTLVSFFRQLDDVPLWVDWGQLDRGGAVLLRAGLIGALVITLYGLPHSYASPAGNKPLVFSGRLTEKAGRRLGETARFVVTTCLPGALRRHGDGFKMAVEVRIMHAQVRRHILQSGRWDADAWGAPINQVHMAGTNLLFSGALIIGLRRLGYVMTRRESEALLALWRYSGYLSGVEAPLLCSTVDEAQRLGNLIAAMEGPPDDDARRLMTALLDASVPGGTRGGHWTLSAYYGLTRALIGDELANGLRLPKTAWRVAVPVIRPLLLAYTTVGYRLPGVRAYHERVGLRGWEQGIKQSLGNAAAEFRLPERAGN